MSQANDILAALERGQRNVLIEWCDDRWHVEVESTDAAPSFWCEGDTVTEALAAVAQVLMAEPGAWIFDAPDEIDVPIDYEPEPLLEYAEPLDDCVRLPVSA